MLYRTIRISGFIVAVVLSLTAIGQEPALIRVERDVAVPMRDGTILRANVFRLAEQGPFPVLVMRTPYGKPAKADEPMVRAGYIVVCQDARGRHASDGKFESFYRDQTHDAE